MARRVCLAATLVAAAAFASGFGSSPANRPTGASIRAALDALWAKYSPQLVGLCAGAVDGGVAMDRCYGKKAAGNNAPTDTRTLFRIESISKTFVATLLALRVHEGSVKLEDPVKMYIPLLAGKSAYPSSLTLVDLADHYSGLPKPTPAGNSVNDFFLKTAACLAKTSCRNDVPGHSYLYSNWGFSVLGNLLGLHDGVSDGPLGPWEKDNVVTITTPLGMPDTRSLPDWSTDPIHFAKHVATSDKKGGPAGAPYADPGGGLYSSAHDMLRWLRFSMGLSGPANLLAAHHLLYDTASLPTAQPHETIGLAWNVNTSTGTSCVWKGGDGEGFHSYMTFVKGVRRGVFLLFNNTPTTDKKRIGKELLNSLPATPGAGSPTC